MIHFFAFVLTVVAVLKLTRGVTRGVLIALLVLGSIIIAL